MKLTKEVCLQALKNLENINLDIVLDELGYEKAEQVSWYGMNDYPTLEKQGDIDVLRELIEEHFSNPPLYMDEIPKGIWIWDNVNKECIRSLGCVELDGIIYVKFERSENSFITNYLEYEPNRFYRKEVQE